VIQVSRTSCSKSKLEHYLSSDKKAEESLRNIEVGNFVVFLYNGKQFVGQLVALKDDGMFEIKALFQTGLKHFRWPNREDKLEYPFEDIVKVLKHPKSGTRGQLYFPDL
jgi:hypothetical protein